MDDKSHVSLEQRLCVVCAARFDTGSLLLDKRLRASMKQYTVIGWGLCADHQKLFDEGFVALIECDPLRSGAPEADGNLKPERAYRTGRLAHLSRESFLRLFNLPLQDKQACVFVEPGVIVQLQSMMG